MKRITDIGTRYGGLDSWTWFWNVTNKYSLFHEVGGGGIGLYARNLKLVKDKVLYSYRYCYEDIAEPCEGYGLQNIMQII